MVDETFDAKSDLQQIREIRAIGRRRAYRQSGLEKYRAEIVALRRAGASLADIQAWLRIHPKHRAALSTISRYIKKLPELAAPGGTDGTIS